MLPLPVVLAAAAALGIATTSWAYADVAIDRMSSLWSQLLTDLSAETMLG
jgi:hypothetical protein